MNCFSLGIIGNFSGHLSGAEKVAETCLPSGLFVVDGLSNNTISTGSELQFPPHGSNIQAEPEFVVKFNVEYANGRVAKLIPQAMTIGNDMTIRQLEGATKIAARKSWGENSKSLASHWWHVDDLEAFDASYKLLSVVKRDGEYLEYTPIANPSELKVFYTEMCDWLVETINNQQSEGICDEVLPQLQNADFPSEIVVFCGAPNYTPWGAQNYIKPSDEISIALVDSNKVDIPSIYKLLKTGNVINGESVISYSQCVI